MKKVILILGVLSVFFACNYAPSSVPETTETSTGTAQSNIDGKEVANTIHSFYAWYDNFQKDETKNISITNDKGKHLVIDTVKMDQYFANIKASGFIGDEFIANEKNILKKCEALWQNEAMDEVPSCLDGDRYFCAQDWDLTFWTTAPVTLENLGHDHVKATMTGTEAGSPKEQQFELKKENGKWVITSIYCDILGEN